MRSILFLLVFTGAALAQQAPPDPAVLQEAIIALRTQRDQAADMHAGTAAQLAVAQREVARLKAEIEAMKKSADQKAETPTQSRSSTMPSEPPGSQ
jgi:hypothetical protein